MKAEITVRRGERKDIPELLDIYNYEVVHGVATLDLEPRTIDEWTTWFETITLKTIRFWWLKLTVRFAAMQHCPNIAAKKLMPARSNYLSTSTRITAVKG